MHWSLFGKLIFLTRQVCLIGLLTVVCFAETVTTTDGRTLILNEEDGTYIIQQPESGGANTYVELVDPFFERHVDRYQQQSIQFMPRFRNVSDSAILGIRFTSSFRDAFGDEIFSFDGEFSDRLSPSATSVANIFYVFENNPFRGGEPYDKLLPMVVGGTGTILTVVTSIALSDGQIIRF